MDFATVLAPGLVFDWAIGDGDLLEDDGLDTAVAIALFTDRVANPDDVLPDNAGDRRGWWGDKYLAPLADGTPDHIGSRLWLLARALQLPQTAQLAQAYCREALQPLLDDGVAAVVDVPLPTFPQRGMMAITVIVSKAGGNGPVSRRYDALWDMTAAAVSTFGVVIGGF